MGLLILIAVIAGIFILNAIFPSFFTSILSAIFSNNIVAIVVLIFAVIVVIYMTIQVLRPLFSGMSGFGGSRRR